jgi:hypothetical protein
VQCRPTAKKCAICLDIALMVQTAVLPVDMLGPTSTLQGDDAENDTSDPDDVLDRRGLFPPLGDPPPEIQSRRDAMGA